MIKLFESIHTSGEKIRKESFCFFVFFFGKKNDLKRGQKVSSAAAQDLRQLATRADKCGFFPQLFSDQNNVGRSPANLKKDLSA